MKPSKLILGAIAVGACLVAHLASAQSGGVSNGEPSIYGGQSQGSGKELSQEQMRQFGEYMDRAKALNRKDVKDAPKKEVVRQRAELIINTLKLSCSLKDVALVGAGSDTAEGKLYQTNTYEVACQEGVGYFLDARDRYTKSTGKLDAPSAATSRAITCFSAEGVRAEDEAKGVHSEFYCQLPDNGGGDIKVMAARLLTAAGASCNVSQFKWFGVNQTAKTEYTELACDNGTGYLLQTTLPGASVAPSAMSCVEASRKGLDCKLTKVAKLPTLLTFKDYLATTTVNCTIDDVSQLRVIGQEGTKKRYVIELQCLKQLKSLIVYIPLEGNPNKFESLECDEAAKRGVKCTSGAKN